MNKTRETVRKFMEERDWMNQPPGDVAKSIVIEAAEVLEKFQWSDFFSEKAEENPESRAEIKKELADVFVYAIQMSIVLDCDIDDIVTKKLEAAAKKYPPELIKGKGSSEKYWEIKKKHRRP